jgi:hypothetical protein
MVYCYAPLGHDLFQITIGDRTADIEKHRKQDHAFGMLRPFERYRHSGASYRCFAGQRIQHRECPEKLRHNPSKTGFPTKNDQHTKAYLEF